MDEKACADCDVKLRGGNCKSCKKIRGEISTVDFYEKKFTGNISCGIAIDIGTTTLAFELLKNGERLAAYSCANSQRVCGADVLSRISSAVSGNAARLNTYILEDIQKGIAAVLSQSGIKKSERPLVVIAGNTTMLHLLQNLPCGTLGVEPFTPVSVESARMNFLGYETVILPGVSAFIGADVIAGLFYCVHYEMFTGRPHSDVNCERFASPRSALAHEVRHQRSETRCLASKNIAVRTPRAMPPFLLIDLGTNGEMVLHARGEYFAASAAAGPAFEGGNISMGIASVPGAIASANFSAEKGVFNYETIGGQPPIGICGTGVTALFAELIRNEWMDKTGLLKTGDSIAVSSGENPVIFTQKDVREVQLAKSAVRAGIEILIAEAEIPYEKIEKVFLAGGFGYKMNAESAAAIGLIPPQLKNKVIPVGNASLGGCAKFLQNPDETEINNLARSVKEINLSAHPMFNECFIKYMDME